MSKNVTEFKMDVGAIEEVVPTLTVGGIENVELEVATGSGLKCS